MVKNFAVIGDPIDHSLSPVIHQAFALAADIKLQYKKIRANSVDFREVIAHFIQEGGIGCNITSPCKEEAYQLVRHSAAQLTSAAMLSQAVNTLTWDNEHAYHGWRGDNTDGLGLIRDLQQNLTFELAGKRILVLGAGGAARGIIPSLLAASPAEILLTSRTKTRALALVEQLNSLAGSSILRSIAWTESLVDGNAIDLIIDAVSLSTAQSITYPRVLLTAETLAYELRYTPQSPFRRWAEEQGIAKFSNGLGMLVEQAAESFYRWHHVFPETRAICQLLAQEVVSLIK